MGLAQFIMEGGKTKAAIRNVVAFALGVLVLYHEVFIAGTAEPLLVFLGLWLCGVPPAVFFDGLRKMTDQAKDKIEEQIGGPPGALPQAPDPSKG